MKIGNFLVPLAMLLIPMVVFYSILAPDGTLAREYYRWAGIDWNDTVADYRSASVGNAVHLLTTICDNGRCIHKIDWACGFTTGAWRFEHEEFGDFIEAVDDCFHKLVELSPLSRKLDVLRKICGRHYMTFDQRAAQVTEERCESAGGVWGEKPRVPWGHQLLLLEAGIR